MGPTGIRGTVLRERRLIFLVDGCRSTSSRGIKDAVQGTTEDILVARVFKVKFLCPYFVAILTSVF